jgi:hypothetical protein
MAREMYCRDCGTVAKTKRVMPGSIAIECVLWLLFLVPGLIYSLWRHHASYQGCRNCHSKNVIPPTSPLAQTSRIPVQVG